MSRILLALPAVMLTPVAAIALARWCAPRSRRTGV